MRKYIYLFLLLLVVGVTAGCNKKEPEPTPDPNPVDPKPIEPQGDPEITLSETEAVQSDDIVLTILNDKLENYDVVFSDKYAFTLSKDGTIRCKRAGQYTITVTNKNNPKITKEFPIVVYSRNFTIYTSSDVIEAGKKFIIEFEGSDNCRETKISDFNITINDEEIASIDGNIVTTKTKGDLVLTFVSKYSDKVKQEISVRVADMAQEFLITPQKDLAQINIGEQVAFDMSDLNGLKIEDFKWSSNTDSVARVTTYWEDQIIVSGVGEGVCDIQCYYPEDPSIRATYRIYVSKHKDDVDYIDRLVRTALHEIGTYEGRDPDGTWNNHQKYGEWYGNNGAEWCATFVSWCWYHAGLSRDLLIKYQGCETVKEWAIKEGLWHLAKDITPKAGDIIFYSYHPGVAGHTGIVAYADETGIYTIEGNYGQHVGVWRVDYTDPLLYGYIRPHYPSCSHREDLSWIKTYKYNGEIAWHNHDRNSHN